MTDEILKLNIEKEYEWLEEVAGFLHGRNSVINYSTSALWWKANAHNVCADYFRIKECVKNIDKNIAKGYLPTEDKLPYKFKATLQDAREYLKAWKFRVQPIEDYITNLAENTHIF